MRHVVDRNGTRWHCSDLGLPAYAHADSNAPDATPRVLVTAVSAHGRRCFLAPLTWESTWSDSDLLNALGRAAPPGRNGHQRIPGTKAAARARRARG
jgi:hypothetical protein